VATAYLCPITLRERCNSVSLSMLLCNGKHDIIGLFLCAQKSYEHGTMNYYIKRTIDVVVSGVVSYKISGTQYEMCRRRTAASRSSCYN